MTEDRGRLKTRERTKEDKDIDAGKQEKRERKRKEGGGITGLPMAACSWFPEPSFRLVFETFHNKDVK